MSRGSWFWDSEKRAKALAPDPEVQAEIDRSLGILRDAVQARFDQWEADLIVAVSDAVGVSAEDAHLDAQYEEQWDCLHDLEFAEF